MKIDVNETDRQITIALTRDLDLASSESVRDEFIKQIDNSHGKRVVVDMSQVRFVNSGGISALVNALKESREKSVDFALAGVNKKVREVLSLTRLDKIFHLIDTEKMS